MTLGYPRRRSRAGLSVLALFAMMLCFRVAAQPEAAPEPDARLQDTLNTLDSLIELQSSLKTDMEALGRKLNAAQSETERKEIQAQLDKLGTDLKTTNRNLREIAAGADINSLRVEFERANTSSLDLVVIADFDGALADLYNRLRRAIQRWCVEACTDNGWEIPFTQLTLHQAKQSGQTVPAGV